MKRHALSTRLWHWINLVCVTVLFMSGLTISNAHPYLYWGDWGFAPQDAWLAVPRFPGWATIPTQYDLAEARSWHLLMAWPFALGLLALWIAMLISGHFRRNLATRLREWHPRALGHDIKQHLRGQFGDEAAGYNPLQRAAYGLVLGMLLPGMVLSGLAISPGFEPAAPWLVDLLGGRQSARSLHFLFAFALLGFTFIHIIMVLVNKPLALLRAMLTGGERKEETAS